MATNPRIPNDDNLRRSPERHLETVPRRKPPSGAWGGVILALIIAAALLAAVLYFMPRTPKVSRPAPGATVPAQATGAMLQLQGLQLSADPSGKSIAIEGQINNNGQQTVTGALMHVEFFGANGANAGSTDVPIELLQVQGKGQKTNVKDTQTLTEAPLKPNDSRPFRIEVSDVPAAWNHQMPQISFTQIASHP